MPALEEFALDGKVALVLGGSSGIGEAIALGYAEAGAHVTVAGRTPAKVEAVLGRLRDRSAAAPHGEALDVTDRQALGSLVDRVIAREGRIDVLVNSQGITRLQPAEQFTPEDYRAIMATNLDSVFFACLAVEPHMRRQGSGVIISIASLASFRGLQLASVYTMSKHGVLGLTRALAAEWAEKGIRVNAIAPGFFLTPLNRERMSQERKDKALDRTPMGRFGEVEELVGAAVYLASPAARFVTGATLPVDGGVLAGMF